MFLSMKKRQWIPVIAFFYIATLPMQTLAFSETGNEESQSSYSGQNDGKEEVVESIGLFDRLFGSSSSSDAKGANANNQGALCVECALSAIFNPSKNVFETWEQCGPNRSYLKEDLEAFQKIDKNGDYLNYREADPAAQVPRKCIAFSMKKIQDLLSGLSFARCDSVSSMPRSAGEKPCLTEQTVNLSYNSFVDVTDCMGLDQKFVVPKIMNESGFNVNSWNYLKLVPVDLQYDNDGKVIDRKMGSFIKKKNEKGDDVPLSEDEVLAKAEQQDLLNQSEAHPKFKYSIVGGDAGVGQFTGPAIELVNGSNTPGRSLLQEAYAQFEKSSKASCQRIAKMVKAGNFPQQLDSNLKNRCQVIKMPPNPLLGFIMYGIYYKQVEQEIKDNWNAKKGARNPRTVPELLRAARLFGSDSKKNTEIERKIQQALVVLSYNTGSGMAMNYFRNWLLDRVDSENSYPVSTDEFNFSRMNDRKDSERKPEAKRLVDLRPEEMNALRDELAELRRNSDLVARDKKMRERKSYLENLGIDRLDFGSFMMVYRTINRVARGYLYGISSLAKELDAKVGAKECTQEKFLEL